MKTVRDVGLLFQRYLTQLLRNPVWVIVGFSTPILYLALFTPLLKRLVGSGGLPTSNVLDLFLPGILSLLALLMVTTAAWSIATALVTKEISGFAAIANGINLPILLLAGVLLPISLGPAWMRVLAHFNPLYYLVQASRVLAAGSLSGRDRKSTRLNSSHSLTSRMPSSA